MGCQRNLKSGYYKRDDRLRVEGVDRQTMFDAMIERILREEQDSNGSLDQNQPKAQQPKNPEWCYSVCSHLDLVAKLSGHQLPCA